MESHKRQAISSQLVFVRILERQELINSSLCRTEASFQLSLHKTFLRQVRVGNASHYSKNELPL
jgi:hypothetical protein